MKSHHPADSHTHTHTHTGHHPPTSSTRRQFTSSLFAASVLAPWALGQAKDPVDIAEGYRQLSEDAEREGLAEPFKGITTDGTVVPGLFEIAPTGVSTEGIRNAAVRFIASLSNLQLVRTMFPIDDVQWRKWMNQNFYTRQGVSFREMTGPQRQAALGLMRASLSVRGFELIRNIMRLNETLAELTNNNLVLGEWAYYITIMGKPSATDPWGWQFQGPHAIINCFVLADQVVMTPLFIGSEPARAVSGKYQGLEVLQKEQDDGLDLVRTLPSPQQQRAVLTFSKTGDNNLTEAFKDNVVLDYAGLRAKELATSSRERLRELVQLYVSNLDDGHARVKMNDVDRHLDDTWFAWIGGTEPDSVFYYRVQSPVILIEFDHQPPVGLAKFAADPHKPTRQHVHCVVRTPNGNDYGKDLLRQHYLSHPHAT
jgi:hypothetical protein